MRYYDLKGYWDRVGPHLPPKCRGNTDLYN
jgi:hypothetical protein